MVQFFLLKKHRSVKAVQPANTVVSTSEGLQGETTLILRVRLSAVYCLSVESFCLWDRLDESISARSVFIQMNSTTEGLILCISNHLSHV